MSDTLLWEYDSARPRTSIGGEARDLLRYRDLLGLLIANSIKSRYKRSLLGVAWTLLNPLANVAVLTIAFATLFKPTVANYPVYLLAGLITWNFFSHSTTYAMVALMSGASLMKRVHVPPSIFAVSAIGHGLVNLALSLVPLALLVVLVGHPLHATWWFVPVGVLILAVFSLGIALLLSTLAIFFADVAEMFNLALQAWFFMTPVMYPPEIVPARWRWVLELNPMTHLLELVRGPVFLGQLPDASAFLASVAYATGMLLVGARVFTRKADEFAYRL